MRRIVMAATLASLPACSIVSAGAGGGIGYAVADHDNYEAPVAVAIGAAVGAILGYYLFDKPILDQLTNHDR